MTAVTLLSLAYFSVAALIVIAAIQLRSRLVERSRWSVRLGTTASLIAFVAATAIFSWAIAMFSGDRSPRTLEIGGAIVYERVALDEPHRQVFHVATVDVDNPCVGLTTTEPRPGGFVDAETGTEFVERTGAALSINVAFFFPFDEYPHWSSYPDTGDEVTAIGPVVIDGTWLGDVDGGWDVGLAARSGRLSAGPVPSDADFAVPGRSLLVWDGRVVAEYSEAYARAIAGVDVDTNSLVLLVADGKQPGYATGSTYRDIAQFLIDRGVDEAVEFDGGGSATMAALVDNEVELLSRPSHQRLPGRQRPVATHLGITLAPDCS